MERERRKGLIKATMLFVAATGGAFGWDMLKDSLSKPDLQQGDLPHTGASEKFTTASKKFTIVYEGQQQPGCVGDIEKVAPIINHAGEIRGVDVFCKPNVVEPGK
jgi:hypothetical protein